MRRQVADNLLLLAVMGLMVFGLVMITSIGVPKSIQLSAPKILYPNCTDPQVDCYLLLKNHFLRMILGVICLLIATKISYRFWRKTAAFWFVLTVLALFLVLAFGRQYTTFARSWIVLFNTSLQPIEFAKLTLIFYLAHFLERKNQDIGTFQYGFLPFCVVTGAMIFPVLLQPDLGGVLVIGLIAIPMYIAAGAKFRHLALGALIVVLGFFLVLAAVPRVNDRVKAFLNQEDNCKEKYCWQTEQANIAVGTGGFWGKGLTQGVQKSYWLPQASDDFIFAASAEELGFVRTLILVLLYGGIAYRGFRIAGEAPDTFSSLTATGITTWVTFQAFLNIAVNIGIFPITGITLPFMSYGGSSLLSLLIAIGVLYNISKHNMPHANYFYRRRNSGSYTPKHRTFIRT